MIQAALLLIGKELERSSVINRIIGMIFLGTPFFSQRKEWAEFGKAITEATNVAQIPDLAQLFDVSGRFRSWLETKAGSRIPIWCFCESLPIYRKGIVSILLLRRLNCSDEGR